MATYESLITIKGSVGDLVFYNLNGKNVVRKKSGFNKNAFKKSPSYEKVRQNSSEFGHCSKTGKLIRQVLSAYIKESEDPLLYQKFAKLMTEIKDLDIVSEKGKRTVKNGIATERGNLLLKQFQFGKKPNLENEAAVSLALWDNTLHLGKNDQGDEIIITSIKIDFEQYVTENFEEKFFLQQQTDITFQKHFTDDDLVLYFAAVKSNGKILKMGFV
ncbi:hypothetical protein [Chryseobacterium populi]|uniref:Uncharacterized protein n=1 Tax=Chryseobacterium populi TaxID=1144316 RepID=J2K4R1_9FLAO|nr:hypothetical protein [Chryseobacterium populi]EJL68243.1 hypothetical protein PMI13_03770 [Chryseobacterium populi]